MTPLNSYMSLENLAVFLSEVFCSNCHPGNDDSVEVSGDVLEVKIPDKYLTAVQPTIKFNQQEGICNQCNKFGTLFTIKEDDDMLVTLQQIKVEDEEMKRTSYLSHNGSGLLPFDDNLKRLLNPDRGCCKPVSLYIYDLSNECIRNLLTKIISKQVDGIWHTSIVVFGNEYFFNNDIQYTRVGCTDIGSPKKVIKLGTTCNTEDELKRYLTSLCPKYNTKTQPNNDNSSFTKEVAMALTGIDVSDYIPTLPSEIFDSTLGNILLSFITKMETRMRDSGCSIKVVTAKCCSPRTSGYKTKTALRKKAQSIYLKRKAAVSFGC